MKMNLKRLSFLLISGAVLFSFCGCTSVKCMVAKGKLRKYMKETYPDDSFTWEEGWGNSSEYITSYGMTGHSKKFPDAEIHASCSRYTEYDDDWSFSSTYLCYLYRQDVEAYIHDIAERVFGACKVYEIPNPLGLEAWDNLSQTNESIENYIKEIRIYVEIFLPPDGLSKEEAADGIKEFEKLLGGKEIYNVKGKVRIITDQETYDNTVSENVPISHSVNNVLVVTAGELNSANAKSDIEYD